MAGAKVVGGPAWRVFEVGSRGPRVRCAAVAHTLHGPLHVNSHAGSSGHVGHGPSVDPRSGGIKKKRIHNIGNMGGQRGNVLRHSYMR